MSEVRLMIRPGKTTACFLRKIATGERDPNRVRLSATFDFDITGRELSRRVYDMRLHRGFTQQELAEKCDVTFRTISMIEADTEGRSSHLPLALLLKICEACGIELARVLDRDWTPPPPFAYKVLGADRPRGLEEFR